MSMYIRDEDVRIRLIGKVRFTDDLEDENKMSFQLLRRLINEAEGDVEQDLSRRFAVPFVPAAGGEFKDLPERPTKEYLRTLCELKAVMRVLETDFGRGSVADADKYVKKLEERYKAMYDKLCARWDDEATSQKQGWKFPPLAGLALAYHNTEADDGYAGMVLVTSKGRGGEPFSQINSPLETFSNGVFDWP